jgi:hypothetical protein
MDDFVGIYTPEAAPETALPVAAINVSDPSNPWNPVATLETGQGYGHANAASGAVPEVDFIDLPGLDNWTNFSLYTHQPFAASGDRKELYLDKLAQLNATLLKYTANINSPTPSGQRNSHNIASVGEMLGFLEELYGILKHYLLTTPIRSAPRLATSSNFADSDEESEPDFAEEGTALNEPLISLATSSSGRRGMDYPTILALSTCYVSLVRLYRTRLEHMAATLDASMRQIRQATALGKSSLPGGGGPQDRSSTSSCNTHLDDIPYLMPGALLDGFRLGNYRSLQISVFVHVSMDLLRRIERAVAALAATDSDGPPASSSNLSLLKAMLLQEARTSSSASHTRKQRELDDGESVGLQSLKILVKGIRKNLRGNVCLQLEEGVPDMDDFAT